MLTAGPSSSTLLDVNTQKTFLATWQVIWSIEHRVVLPFPQGIVIQCLVVQCNVVLLVCACHGLFKNHHQEFPVCFFLRCLWFRVLNIQYVIPLVNGFLFVCLSVCFALNGWKDFPAPCCPSWFITVHHWPLVKTWSCILGTFLGLFFYTLFCLQTVLGWHFITGFEINTVIPPTVILHSLDCLGHLRFFVNVEFIFNFCKKKSIRY